VSGLSLVEGENFIREPFWLVALAELVRRQLDQA